MRWIAMLLVILLVFPGAIFGNAGKPRGNKAAIYTAEGKYRGTLLYIDSELLVLKEKKSGELLGFATPQVKKVYLRKSKAGIGIAAGLAVGVGVLGIVLLIPPQKGGDIDSALRTFFVGMAVIGALFLTVFTAAGGGLLGSILGWKRFKFHKMNELEKETALKKLQRYALWTELPAEMRNRLVMVTN
jgi:hypothetical protein